MLLKKIAAVIIIVLISGCVSTKSSDVFVQKKYNGPKKITMAGTRAPWAFEIIKRLKKKGFEVKRLPSQYVTTEQITESKKITYNEASAQFVLVIDGYAPNTSMTRCFGGGYNFDYISAEFIDLQSNETIFYYSNSGYSEGCPPLSGTIFTDVVTLVSDVWK